MGPKNTEKEKVEQKVRRRPGRVPTSCAECRRLKLRCDRNAPCESCMKRGCAAICPEGSLTTGKGNRLVLANTEELHEKIERLCSRIRDLEDALRSIHATVSDSPHPLLQDALLTLKAPDARNEFPPGPVLAVARSDSSRADEDHIVDAFGTLTIGSGGETKFLGKTARSEYLIQAPSKPSPLASVVYPRLSKRLAESYCGGIEPPLDEDLVREVYELLPPLSEALHLCEMYHKHGQYLYTTIPRSELFDEILSNVYGAESLSSFRVHHAMTLLFSVFALGVHLDPDRAPYSIEAKEFYHLSHVAMRLTPPSRETTLDIVQAVLHMAHFLQLNDMEATAWASDYADLNSARWRLDDSTSQRRSRLFWSIFQLDTWISFGFGRPPTTSPAYIDCALPKDIDEFTTPSGQKEMGFHSWCWQFTRLLHTVMTTAFGAKMPPYIAILDLDRKIRDFPVPCYLTPNCHGSARQDSPELQMQRWWVLSSKEATLLNLHRCYFADALRDQPNDLLKHRYGPSVIAAYRSAYRLIQGLKSMPCEFAPHHLSKFSLSWSYGLSASIVMCLLVTRAPCSNLATSSLEQLDLVTSLFEQFAPNSRAASTNLESIQRLRRKAHEAIDISLCEETTSLTPTELDRLGGKTHLISDCVPPAQLEPSANSSLSTSPAYAPLVTSGASSSSDVFMLGNPEALENIHPTIVEDMKIFDGLDGSTLPPFHDIFDLPTGPLPQAMPDFQFPDPSIFGIDMFNSYPSSGSYQTGHGLSASGYVTGPPVLDATWQSFVEQLGF